MKKIKSRTGPADALLEAHVRYIVEELTGPGLMKRLGVILDGALEDTIGLTLATVVTRDTIKAVARTYVSELDLGGGIPELVGDVARALHAHPLHDRTCLADLVPDRRFEDLLGHALALRSIRERLIREAIASPLYQQFASDLLYNGIRDYLARGAATSGIPGARSAMKLGKAMVSRARPGLEDMVEEGLKRYIGRSVGAVSEKSVQPLIDGDHDDALRDVAIDSWQRIKGATIGGLRTDLTALDVEELFVTLYEWWKELRRTEFVGAMLDSGVDAFFDKYGDTTLPALLEDIGITRQIMLGEAKRFAPQVIAALHARGVLEPTIRRGLEPYYRSEAFEKAFAAAVGAA